jgi:Acetyltransferase (GNAT) domain
MKVRIFQPKDALQWDSFCRESLSGTFLHTRRFLSYHGERFEDQSLIIEGESGKWLGLLPAARHPVESGTVVSHPGITYGSLLTQRSLAGEAMIEAFQTINNYYRMVGFNRFCYKAMPHLYHRVPSQDDLYALFRLKARRYRVDLSCAIDLELRLPVSERRRRGYKKALKAGVTILQGREFERELWRVLEDNLARKHEVRPVHALEEIGLLADRFPENVSFIVGIIGDQVEAGVVLFKTPTVHHAQYIASSEQGYLVCALDAIFEHCITKAMNEKVRWFDFGTSNEQNGWMLNEGLYRFKSEFGGGGVAYEFYEINLA